MTMYLKQWHYKIINHGGPKGYHDGSMGYYDVPKSYQ